MESAKIPASVMTWAEIERWALRLLAGLSGVAILVFIATALVRLGYPYEIEWIEGATVDGLRRILSGHLLYAPPELAYLPPPYTPLYYYLSAAVMALVGEGFVAPRLVAILATLGCLGLLYRIVADQIPAGERREAVSLPGLIAAGLYAASFMFTGQWFDLARPDSLALVLLLAGLWVQLRWSTPRGLAVAGALYALAYFSKQNMLVPIAFLGLGSLVRHRLNVWPLAVSLGIVSVGPTLLLNLASDGWYWFYTVDMLSHNVRSGGPETFWQLFVPVVWPGLLAVLAYFVLPLLDRQIAHPVVRNHFVLLWFACGLILSSWLVWMQRWTAANGHMPAMLAVALLVGLLLGYLRARPTSARGVALSAAVIVQFGLLAYNPAAAVPSAADRRAGDGFIAWVRDLPGEGWIVDHGFLAHLAGRQTYFHATAFADFSGIGASSPRSYENAWRRLAVQGVLTDTLKTQRFDWIIADSAAHGWPPYYLVERQVFDQAQVFTTLAGVARRPNYLLMRNPIVYGGPVPLNDPRYSPYLQGAWGAARGTNRRDLQGEATLDLMLDGRAAYAITVSIDVPCAAAGVRVSLSWRGALRLSDQPLVCGGDALTLMIPPESVEEAFGQLHLVLSAADGIPVAPVAIDVVRTAP